MSDDESPHTSPSRATQAPVRSSPRKRVREDGAIPEHISLPVKKRRKITFPDDLIIHMSDWWQDHPEFYDTQSVLHRDRSYKQEQLRLKVQDLKEGPYKDLPVVQELTIDGLRTWMASARDKVTRGRTSKSGQAALPTPTQDFYRKALPFIKDCVARRKGPSRDNLSPTQPASEQEDLAEENIGHPVTPTTSQAPIRHYNKKHKEDVIEKTLNTLVQVVAANEQKKTLNPVLDGYIQVIAGTMKNVRPESYLICFNEMMSVLNRHQLPPQQSPTQPYTSAPVATQQPCISQAGPAAQQNYIAPIGTHQAYQSSTQAVQYTRTAVSADTYQTAPYVAPEIISPQPAPYIVPAAPSQQKCYNTPAVFQPGPSGIQDNVISLTDMSFNSTCSIPDLTTDHQDSEKIIYTQL